MYNYPQIYTSVCTFCTNIVGSKFLTKSRDVKGECWKVSTKRKKKKKNGSEKEERIEEENLLCVLLFLVNTTTK